MTSESFAIARPSSGANSLTVNSSPVVGLSATDTARDLTASTPLKKPLTEFTPLQSQAGLLSQSGQAADEQRSAALDSNSHSDSEPSHLMRVHAMPEEDVPFDQGKSRAPVERTMQPAPSRQSSHESGEYYQDIDYGRPRGVRTSSAGYEHDNQITTIQASPAASPLVVSHSSNVSSVQTSYPITSSNPSLPSTVIEEEFPTTISLPDEETPKNEDLEIGGMWHGRWCDLKGRYPLSFRWVIKKTFWWFSASIVLLGVYLARYGVQSLFLVSPADSYDERHFMFLALRILLVLFGVQALYWEFYRRSLDYYIDGFRLQLTKGIVKREQGSVCLLPITEVYVRRSWLDFVLGLCHVNIYSPLDNDRNFALIDGFSIATGQSFRDFLDRQLNKQNTSPPAAGVNQATGQLDHAVLQEVLQRM